ncbi:MAG: caspase family protein [Blastocatellia bacterium]
MVSRGRLFALLVGINEYEAMCPLRFAVDDVLALKDVLEKRLDFSETNIVLLTDAISESDPVPQRAEILSRFEQVASAKMGDEDTFLFQFSGHGFAVEKTSYLMPFDARPELPLSLEDTAISLKMLTRYWEHITASQQIFILDACRKAIFANAKGDQPGFDQNMERDAVALIGSSAKAAPRSGRAVLSACQLGQRSFEFEAEKKGWFTFHLLQCLREYRGLELNIDDLDRQVKQRMEDSAFRGPRGAVGQRSYFCREGEAINLPLRPLAPVSRGLRRVDAAVKSNASIGEHLDVIVQVRFPDSSYLGSEDVEWPGGRMPEPVTQESEGLAVKFATDPATGKAASAQLSITLVAPNFKIRGSKSKTIDLVPDTFSPIVKFVATPNRSGPCRIDVEVSEGKSYLGAIPLETTIGGAAGTHPIVACLRFKVLVVPTAGRPESDKAATQDELVSSLQKPDAGDVTDSEPHIGDLIVPETPPWRAVWLLSRRLKARELWTGGIALFIVAAIVLFVLVSHRIRLTPTPTVIVEKTPIPIPTPIPTPIPDAPAISIEHVPHSDKTGEVKEEISGVVTGVRLKDIRGFWIAIYQVRGPVWTLEPPADSPKDSLTSLGTDGKWRAPIYTGEKYVVLLVKPGFVPEKKTPTLPTVGGDVVATTGEVQGRPRSN